MQAKAAVRANSIIVCEVSACGHMSCAGVLRQVVCLVERYHTTVQQAIDAHLQMAHVVMRYMLMYGHQLADTACSCALFLLLLFTQVLQVLQVPAVHH
jgi:hypothetical protein